MLKSFFKWLYYRKQRRQHSTRLLGNTGLPGSSTLQSEFTKRSTFQRASFGKYDTRFYRQLWFRIFLLIGFLTIVCWLSWDVITSFNIFS